MENKLKKERFELNINTIFKLIDSQENSLDLKLFKIEEKDSEAVYSFSLLFEGPLESVAYDNTYRFSHDKMGEFFMFISPYIKTKNKILYESTFSILKNEEVI